MRLASPVLALLLATRALLAQAAFEDINDGQVLAAKLRHLVPEEEPNAQFTGTLKIRRGKERSQVLISGGITVLSNAWHATYQSRATGKQPAERLTIIHRPGQSNEYLYARATSADGTFPKPERLNGAAAAIPFAGSDFWLSDLGLEFLHWPQQKIVAREMRKSRPCKVLASRPGPSSAHPYVRVVSWVDNETGGLVIAEAYDRADKRLKQFEVKSFSKANGRWQLEEMEIENVQAHSRTLLEFDIETEK